LAESDFRYLLDRGRGRAVVTLARSSFQLRDLLFAMMFLSRLQGTDENATRVPGRASRARDAALFLLFLALEDVNHSVPVVEGSWPPAVRADHDYQSLSFDLVQAAKHVLGPFQVDHRR
jgi:hypothetical protein